MQCRHNPAGRQLGLPTTTRGASVQVTAPHTAAAKCTRLSCAHPESLAALQMYIDTCSRWIRLQISFGLRIRPKAPTMPG